MRKDRGAGKWCAENDAAHRAELAAIHELPAGKWCACGFPHETGGPCWECRAQDHLSSKEPKADG